MSFANLIIIEHHNRNSIITYPTNLIITGNQIDNDLVSPTPSFNILNLK